MITATRVGCRRPARSCRTSALTGGVDCRLAVQVAVQPDRLLGGSHVRGDAEAIDAHPAEQPPLLSAARTRVCSLDPDAHALDGIGGAGSASTRSAASGSASTSNVGFKSPGFDINDLGFLRRADERSMNNWFQIRSDMPTRWFRSRYLNFNQYARWNFDGDRARQRRQRQRAR